MYYYLSHFVCCFFRGDRDFCQCKLFECQHVPQVRCACTTVCGCVSMSAWHLKEFIHICPGVNLGICLQLWHLFVLVCMSHVHLCMCVCMCMAVILCLCMLRSWGQSRPGLSVPPDITLLSSGTDPAAEVGRPTAPLLWVGEKWRAM